MKAFIWHFEYEYLIFVGETEEETRVHFIKEIQKRWTDETVKKFAYDLIWDLYGKKDCIAVVDKYFEQYTKSGLIQGEEETSNK